MARFTIELGELMQSGFNIGLQDYPIFDESYREQLNAKIIEHYYFREIGMETAGLFARYFNRRMNEVMPYYNKLYKSELIAFDPLETHSALREIVANDVQEGTTSNVHSGDNNSTSAFHDTPMGLLESPLDGKYATNMNADKSSQISSDDSNQVSTANRTSDTMETASTGSRSALLQQYRDTFLNIDMEVIDSLSDLFMGLFA